MDEDKLGSMTVEEKVDAYIIVVGVLGLIGHVLMIRFDHRLKNFLQEKAKTVVTNRDNSAYYEFQDEE